MPHRRYHERIGDKRVLTPEQALDTKSPLPHSKLWGITINKAEIIRVRIRDEHGSEKMYAPENLPSGKIDFDEEYDIFLEDSNHIPVASRKKPEPVTNYYKITKEDGKEECLVQKNGQTRIIRMDGMGQIKYLFRQIEKFNRRGKRVLIVERRLKPSLETTASSPAQ